MENKRHRPWLWIAIAVIGIGIYVFSTRPAPISILDETSGAAEPVPPPDEAPLIPQRSPQGRDALSPATGIADDAAEAVRRMNEDAQRMMENPEMMPEGTRK